MKKGFTLIEVMLVVLIIGIISALALPNLKNISARNNTAKAKAELRALQIAVENYYLYHDSTCPAALSDLVTAVPIIIRKIPQDPYSKAGGVYGYAHSPNKKYYVVYSIGPSGGSASVGDDGIVSESNGPSCIYVSNTQEDTTP